MTLVCFDLGRVLVRIAEGWTDAFERAGLAAVGHEVEARFRSDDGKAVRKAFEVRLHALEHGTISPDVFCLEGAKVLGLETAQMALVLDTFIHGAYPGAVALLDDLRRAGVRTACLSNTNARHFELMEGWLEPEDRVLERIEVKCASHELGLRKPDAAIYEALEQRAGVRASDIVFFDDLPPNVAAASARGWDAVLVESREDPVGEMRTHLRRRKLL